MNHKVSKGFFAPQPSKGGSPALAGKGASNPTFSDFPQQLPYEPLV
jgi:hypothetical protein